MNGLLKSVHIKSFFIQYNIGLDISTAFLTLGYTLGRVGNVIDIIELTAFDTVIPECRAVELQNLLRACRLMKSVDILRYNGFKLSGLLKLGKLYVCGIGLGALYDQLVPVELIELCSVPHIESV